MIARKALWAAVAGTALLSSAWVLALPASKAQPPATKAGKSPAQGERVLLVCEAVYLPTRAVWKRTVTIDYDQKAVKAVTIDGVPVYTFSVTGTVIRTSQDNERIQIDLATQTWVSDFRGAASSQGHCERGV